MAFDATEVSAGKWDLRAARRGALDGEFLVGLPDEGAYHLPSCVHARSKATRRATFASPALAKAAGLRPCKTCHPEKFHAARRDDLSQFKQLLDIMATEPTSVSAQADLANLLALTPGQLHVLIGDHAHLPVQDWLARQRIQFAARRLLETQASPMAIGAAAGFADAPSYERAFVDVMHMTPAEYRMLGQRDTFALRLPADFRTSEVLSYQGRDPAGLAERTVGQKVIKALSTAGGPAVLTVSMRAGEATVAVSSARKLDQQSFAKLHRDALKILGLNGSIEAFQARHPELVGDRAGLRVPLIPSAFDALCWAIVGQQINLSFAGSLRRELITLAGEKIGDMRVHPTPAALAALDPDELTSRRFSRSKTKYLLHAAQAISSGQFDVEALVNGSAIDAEATLTAQPGIGTWTARYVMMRSGFTDAAPVGDSGLATALQRMFALPERPDVMATAQIMAKYAPWRSFASAHLWASL
jgi:AraC family transcriptional regulator, regulatory protein of adaptative response / DNA-3-methyladenine glycosylase II